MSGPANPPGRGDVQGATGQPRRRLRVGVLFGGRSGEHEVSIVSAISVMNAMDPERYDVVPIGITRHGRWLVGGDPLHALRAAAGDRGALKMLASGAAGESPPAPIVEESTAIAPVQTATHALAAGLDVVFPVLHGPYGEDGTVQGFLELAGLPYVGAGVLGSALGMDKAMMKSILRNAGLPVMDFRLVLRRRWEAAREAVLDEMEAAFGYPCFTKPANLGSSVGVAKAHDRAELAAGLDLAARYDRKLLVEQAAQDCREVEVSVLGNDDPEASVVGEIISSNEFYDYNAKYVDGQSRAIIPAPISEAATAEVRRLAVAAFRALDCCGMARVDFFVSRCDERAVINELNTIPGFTAISMYPQLWEASGLPYPRLIDRLIELALERHHDRQRSQTTYE